MSPGYNHRKAAQVVALLVREQGSDIADYIKTIKLVYLSDRQFLDEYEEMILNDEFANLPHGPVNEETFAQMKRVAVEDQNPDWAEYILPRKGNSVRLAKSVSDKDLDELSRAEIRVIKSVVERFKGYKPFELVDWVHNNCSEWIDPNGSSRPLAFFKILKALGKENFDEIYEQINSLNFLRDELQTAK